MSNPFIVYPKEQTFEEAFGQRESFMDTGILIVPFIVKNTLTTEEFIVNLILGGIGEARITYHGIPPHMLQQFNENVECVFNVIMYLYLSQRNECRSNSEH